MLGYCSLRLGWLTQVMDYSTELIFVEPNGERSSVRFHYHRGPRGSVP
jgi:hypothetical protein